MFNDVDTSRITDSTVQGFHTVNASATPGLTEMNGKVIAPQPSNFFVSGQASHNTIASTNDMTPVCEGICAGVTVFAALIGILLSIYLFISFIPWCRINISGRINNIRRRTHSPVIATVDTTRSIELESLPPYPGNFLPSYPGSTIDIVDILPRGFWPNDIMQDLPIINVAPTLGPQTSDERISNHSHVTLTNTVANISTSPDSSNIDSTLEISIPLTPRISTIQLPPVHDEIDINDLVPSSVLLLQHRSDSDNADLDEISMPTVPLDVSSSSLDYNNNSDSTPLGALGIIFKGGASLTSGTSICVHGADIEDSPSVLERAADQPTVDN